MRIPVILATWFGCGRSPLAPGTVGTLGALPLVVLGWWSGSLPVQAGLAAGTLLLGLVVARDSAAFGGRKDPPEIVIDEVAGMLVAALGLAPSWQALALAFALFRVADIVKPWPCRRLEALASSWGIMADDVMAGVYANIATVLLLRAPGLLA